MPKPRNKKLNSIKDVREKERLEKKREERKKYNKKKAVEIATTKKPSYKEMLSKVKVPPKTAMDSVRTMSDKSMKKDTMTQMKKKDMMYGGKKMANGGTTPKRGQTTARALSDMENKLPFPYLEKKRLERKNNPNRLTGSDIDKQVKKENIKKSPVAKKDTGSSVISSKNLSAQERRSDTAKQRKAEKKYPKLVEEASKKGYIGIRPKSLKGKKLKYGGGKKMKYGGMKKGKKS